LEADAAKGSAPLKADVSQTEEKGHYETLEDRCKHRSFRVSRVCNSWHREQATRNGYDTRTH
jgi:hypothetical protein